MLILRTMLVVAAGAMLFERLQVPAGALIGGMVAALVLNLTTSDMPALPEWARFASFAALGWMLGHQFTRETLATLQKALLPIVIVVVTLLGAALVVALALQRLGLDPATAFLSATPAGISQMAALSVDVGADSSVVVATHLVRVITVVTIAPFVVRAVLE